ncbi:hypothetical protein D9757_006437 [Collybiopsis confluens]|uniref:GlcNAc kinase n=1 Tax=Collybiopsis confluens TaxID=2823264 RepID=A0A8H5HJM9_9AGAR|nr:hypothetical protein D9757_006437 [Collybiopsis confluens]
MSLYLCVDCGGSKTSAVIVSASTRKVVGRANGGPSNIAYLSVSDFIQTIQMTVGEALKTCVEPASVEPIPIPLSSDRHISFAAAWFGISGADSPSIISSILPDLSHLLGIPTDSGRLIVANDAHLLAAPIRLYESEGVTGAVTVIGGTGSIVVSFTTQAGSSSASPSTNEPTPPQNKDDLIQLGRIGGWGWILGDEGGGFSVGREAVRQILQEQDAHSIMADPPPEGALRKSIKEWFGIQDIMQLLTELYLPDPASGIVEAEGKSHKYMAREKRLSSLSPLVFDAAFPSAESGKTEGDGDPLALSIIRTCAEDLADQIGVVVGAPTAERPKLLKPEDSVLCFGGSLVGLERYRKMVLDELDDKGFRFRYVEFVDDCARIGAEAIMKKFENA